MTVFTHKGIELELPDWLLGTKIEDKIRRGHYEKKEAEAARKRLREGMKVLEIGAGLGFVTSICAQIAGAENVVSVEADPKMLDPIRGNLARNGHGDVTLIHGAVVPGEYQDDTVMFRPGTLFWGGSLPQVPTSADRLVDVPALQLTTLLKQVRPKFVMMDIEGAEQHLFYQPWPRFVRFVVLELHPSKYDDNAIHRIMQCMGASGLAYDPVSSNGTTLGFKRFRRGK